MAQEAVRRARRHDRHRRAPLGKPAERAGLGGRGRAATSCATFQAGGDDTLALSGRVPGLYAETTTGRIFPRFYIRGLGNIDFYLGASQPVSIIQDDVVLEHVVLKSNPVFDVEQVEVLRGPQGSLFGRNTTAGIIKFDTIRPSQDFQGRATASLRQLRHRHLRRRRRRADRRRQARRSASRRSTSTATTGSTTPSPAPAPTAPSRPRRTRWAASTSSDVRAAAAVHARPTQLSILAVGPCPRL